MSNQRQIRSHVPEPPRGRERLRWYGPGLLWMISSVGSGSVLFTPRVGARYEYAFLWALLVVVFFMWVMIREVGRYTVVTGKTVLNGYRGLRGPRNWAVWLIFVPQLVAGAVTIAGIAALLGSAMMIAFPGTQILYAVAFTLVSIVLVVSGHYHGVERAASIMAGLLVAAVLVTAARVFPEPGVLGAGLVPTVPENLDLYFVLPWLGFILAGAAGVMWFSYWVAAREFGGPLEHRIGGGGSEPDVDGDSPSPKDQGRTDDERGERLEAWLKVTSTTAAIGVIGGGIVVVSFLILGAELLAPEGTVPSGIRVAEDLTRLLSDIWGRVGYWLLIGGIVVALWGTILADQDGWGRTFADATLILLPMRTDDDQSREGRRTGEGGDQGNGERLPLAGSVVRHLEPYVRDRERLKNAYAVIMLTAVPLVILFLVRDPVSILSVGGIVAAAHTPVVVFLTLYLNKTELPDEFQPGKFSTWSMVLAGTFFAVFAGLYLLDLVGINLRLS